MPPLHRFFSAASRRHLLRGLAALASAVPLFRPGNFLPGACAPLLGAPPPGEAPRHGGPAPRERLRLSLKASVAEGMFAEVFTACVGATALTAWALALKLGPFLVGVMTSLPFLAQFVQFPAGELLGLLWSRLRPAPALAEARASNGES